VERARERYLREGTDHGKERHLDAHKLFYKKSTSIKLATSDFSPGVNLKLFPLP
jgi:uncharacterized protein YheU (UPF0270 family)